MSKHASRLLILVLTLVIILSGCSQSAKALAEEEKKTEEQTKAQDEKKVVTPTEEKKEKVTIEFWYGLGSIAGETMEELIAEFNQSQDKVQVQGVQQPSYTDTLQKLQAGLAAKKVPAVFITDTMVTLAEMGILAPLDPYMDQRTPLEDYLDVFMEPARIDGKTYAFPSYGTTQVIYYRKDLLEKAGVDPKDMYSSWQNVYKYSKELQEKGIAEFGHLPMWGRDNLIDLALSSGGSILSEDKKTVTFTTDAWIQSWEMLRKEIFETKSTMVESGGQGWEYWYRTIDDVLSGKAISYTGSSGDKGDLDFAIIDSIPQPGFGENPAHPIAGGLYLAVPELASEEQKAAAYEWIAFFTSPEVSARWSQKIGYIPVRKSAMEVQSYKTFIEENPYAGVPYEQALHAAPRFVDPTGGKIFDALNIAADRLELENVPAKEALEEAQEAAQKALDEVNK